MKPQESYCSIPMPVADGVFTRFFSQKSLNTNATIDKADSGDSAYQTSCSFTGKEKDPETGYSYFGARYLEHEMMTTWMSVDPMSDKYPSLSPYAYCAWNPVKLVDPDGKEIGDFYDEEGNYIGSDGKKDDKIYVIKQTSKRFNSKPGPNGERAEVDYISSDDRKKTIDFIKNNNQKQNAFTEDCIAYRNSFEIESFYTLQLMYNSFCGHKEYQKKEIGGVVDANGEVCRIKVGTQDVVYVEAYLNSDRCWFHYHIKNQKSHGGFNESILDSDDRYHAPSYTDTQQFIDKNPNFTGYTFDTQYNRTYVTRGGRILGYISTDAFIQIK